MSTGAWALYNGCISYLLIGVLLLLEMAYRGVYQRRHEPDPIGQSHSNDKASHHDAV